MIQRFSGRPEHAPTGQQGADQHRAPIEQFQARFGLSATQPEFADGTDGNDHSDQKHQQHHPLPEPTEGRAHHGFAVVGELLGQGEIDG